MSTLTIQHFFEAAQRAQSTDCFVAEQGSIKLVQQKEEPRCWGLWSSLSDKDRFLNWQTWVAFKHALEQAAGIPERFTRIEKRYKFKWETYAPLRLPDVEKAGVGLARVFVPDLEHFLNCYLCTLGREGLDKAYKTFRGEDPFIGIFEDNGGEGFSMQFNHFIKDKKRQHHSHRIEGGIDMRIPEQPNFSYIDRLAKSFSSYELQRGEIIPMLLPDGSVDYFEVYKKVGTGHGLVGYALRPIAKDSTLAPTFLLRATQISPTAEDAVESFLNVLEKNIGFQAYQEAKPRFDDLFNDREFRKEGQKVHLIGFSQGGTHCMRLLCDHWRDIEEATFINAPSIEVEAAQRLAQEVNGFEASSTFLTIHHYRNCADPKQLGKGDIATYFGGEAVGCGFTNPHVRVFLREFQGLKPSKKPADRALGPHLVLPLEQKDVVIWPRTPEELSPEDLNKHLNNATRPPPISFYESRRQQIAPNCLYPLINAIYRLVAWVLSFFGIEFRTTRLPLAVT